MAKPVMLPDGKKWGTQSEALSHFKNMLARYADGQIVDSIEDHDDLVALLERHDQLGISESSKIGAGISYFERRLNRGEGYSSHGFWVIRVDGTETDFSYVKTIKGMPMSVLEQYYGACRSAVGADLAAEKQRQFDHFADLDGKIPCDVSGVLVQFSEAQLRHSKPYFGEIVREFRVKNGWSEDDLVALISTSNDAQISTKFRHSEDSEAFREFHHSRAVLHIVSNTPEHGAFQAGGHVVKKPIRIR